MGDEIGDGNGNSLVAQIM